MEGWRGGRVGGRWWGMVTLGFGGGGGVWGGVYIVLMI